MYFPPPLPTTQLGSATCSVQEGIVDGVVVADTTMWALLSDRVHVRRYDPGANLWRDELASDVRLAGGRSPSAALC